MASEIGEVDVCLLDTKNAIPRDGMVQRGKRGLGRSIVGGNSRQMLLLGYKPEEIYANNGIWFCSLCRYSQTIKNKITTHSCRRHGSTALETPPGFSTSGQETSACSSTG